MHEGQASFPCVWWTFRNFLVSHFFHLPACYNLNFSNDTLQYTLFPLVQALGSTGLSVAFPFNVKTAFALRLLHLHGNFYMPQGMLKQTGAKSSEEGPKYDTFALHSRLLLRLMPR